MHHAILLPSCLTYPSAPARWDLLDSRAWNIRQGIAALRGLAQAK